MTVQQCSKSSTTEASREQKVHPLRGVVRIAVCFIGLTAFGAAAFAQVSSSPRQNIPADAGAPTVTANLNITPKRLAFKRGERSGTVYIYNQGSAPAVFDVSIVDRIMLPSGEIESVAQAQNQPEAAAIVSRLKSAKDLLVATPRRVTLAPGKGQTIRLRVTAPASADAAEYRSHLTVTTVPPRSVGITPEEAAKGEQSDQLSFQIASLFGISIPVIVRTAPPDVRAAISNVRLTYETLSPDGKTPPRRTPILSMELERSGASSLFGNIEIRGKGGKALLGIARGLGVYTEIDRRLVYVPLQRSPSAGEQLEISFVDDDVNPGRVITRTTFVGP